jgi:hypothetical protein
MLKQADATPCSAYCASDEQTSSQNQLGQAAECWNGVFHDGLDPEQAKGAKDDGKVSCDSWKSL